MSGAISLRHGLQPGDLGFVTALHGQLYAAEHGYDHRFESYVAQTVGEFGLAYDPARDRLWIAELDGQPVGCIGILGRQNGEAQLRWVLVHPDARGRGLGRRLLAEAIAFCRAAGYRSVYLWTVHTLETAARLYLDTGFRKTETKPAADLWGQRLAEERYDLTL
jgi:GNAT superfamily N-acetyltransferase